MCDIGMELREVEFEPLAVTEPEPEPVLEATREDHDERAPQRI